MNSTSGKGQALRKAEILYRRLSESSTVQLLPTTHSGSAVELAIDVAGSVDRVIAVGGDGTLNEVLNGLMNAKPDLSGLPELGFLPAGTGNAARHAFKLHTDPEFVAGALEKAGTESLDVGVVHYEGGQRAFLLWFGAGWDGLIMHMINQNRSKTLGVTGLVGQVPRVLREIARYDEPDIEVEVDGSSFGLHASVFVANVGNIAFGFMVSEHTDPADGVFDIFGISGANLLQKFNLGLRMMVSKFSRSPLVSQRQGSEIKFQSNGKVPIQIDGEAAGFLPATVTLQKAAVKLLQT